jgi:hypothetical protein
MFSQYTQVNCFQLDGLRRDLFLWTSGLFPFFEYSATSVKVPLRPSSIAACRLQFSHQLTLLNIYNAHFLPLQGSLRPVMKSFILALLPGLEEETGEFFEQVTPFFLGCSILTQRQVLSLLDRLSTVVSLSFFLENVWLIMLTIPPARGTALNLVSRRLPRLVAENGMSISELHSRTEYHDRARHNAWT